MATIKNIQSNLEATTGHLMGWNKKHCNFVAKMFIEQINYMKDVLKSFPDAFIVIQEDIITVTYKNGYGKISISEIEHTVFIPAMYQSLDNKRIINNSNRLQVA